MRSVCRVGFRERFGPAIGPVQPKRSSLANPLVRTSGLLFCFAHCLTASRAYAQAEFQRTKISFPWQPRLMHGSSSGGRETETKAVLLTREDLRNRLQNEML